MFRSSSRPIWIIRLGFRFYSVMFGGVLAHKEVRSACNGS
jgi:hypothetical protein